jgi:hypothetical protein
VGHPALVFIPALVQPVDARHPDYDRGEVVDAGVVPDVLVRAALGTAVERMEVERALFGDAQREVFVLVPLAALDDGHLIYPAVHLVGGGVEERCASFETVRPTPVGSVAAASTACG